MLKRVTYAGAALALLSVSASAETSSYSSGPGGDDQQHQCSIPSYILDQVKGVLNTVVALPDGNGGLFPNLFKHPNKMWAAVVDRQGVVCTITNTGTPPKSDPWPGSRAIAMAKAFTANGFSNDELALSTANLYGVTQPGGSLYGLNNSNPFNPRFDGPIVVPGPGIGSVAGGIITFGGGVALYKDGKVIGGLGVSGDTACADHAIAYRMRSILKLDKVPAGVGTIPKNTDNINYSSCPAPAPGAENTPECVAKVANTFEHPHCSAFDLSAAAIAAPPK